MTSAIYLNNIPKLGHACHAIKILNDHANGNLKLVFHIDKLKYFDNLYLLENFADFINPQDCVNLFNFLKSTNKNVYIFISEDPNHYKISDPKIFLLNYKCDFRFYLILKIISRLNISIFSKLYYYLFICDIAYIKFFRKKIFSILKIDNLKLLWAFRSSIYSKVLDFQKNVIIPNKRTLGSNRVLETCFSLNAIKSNFKLFNLNEAIDPFDYKASLACTNFSNLYIHIEALPSNHSLLNLERLCYFNNLINKNSLSVYFKSISDFFINFNSLQFDFSDSTSLKNIYFIIRTDNDIIFTKYKSLINYYFLLSRSPKTNFIISQSTCL